MVAHFQAGFYADIQSVSESVSEVGCLSEDFPTLRTLGSGFF